jgi:CubicO group peptidase (beta-lactamase class C family)
VTEQELTDLLHEHASAHAVPGAVVGVLRDGMATVACYGVADARTGAPVTPESRFGAGSLTKSMTATVVARLAASGRLSMDDPVAARVPELAGLNWAERATIRDLLASRSGLPLRADLEFGFAAHEGDDDEALARFVARIASEAPTSIAWSYSNAGWCVLGRAIEIVTGDSWEDAMRAQLFAPAGMGETSFATEGASALRVSGHEPAAVGPVPVEPLVVRALAPCGTSAESTAGDLLRFAAVHLGDPALAVLRSAQPSPRIHGWFDGWCLGWARFEWDGGCAWGWDSVLPGERAFLRLVPERDAAVVLMTNSENGRSLARSLLPGLVSSLFGRGVPALRLDAATGAAGELARFEGTYAWPDRVVEVTATPATLVVEEEGNEVEALPIDEQTFLVDAEHPDTPTITFGDFDAAGRPRALYFALWGLPRVDG